MRNPDHTTALLIAVNRHDATALTMAQAYRDAVTHGYTPDWTMVNEAIVARFGRDVLTRAQKAALAKESE